MSKKININNILQQQFISAGDTQYMNKLEQYRQTAAAKWENTADQYNETFLWKTGFDAAINLDLPVLFHDWEKKAKMEAIDELQKYSGDDKKEKFTSMVARFRNTKELYYYWINNIYNSEL